MLDAYAKRIIDPPLNRLGRRLATRGISANAVTLIGLAFGLASALAIVFGQFALAVVLLLASRLADGLDGAVARATRKTTFGGYLDIACDFLVYGLIPLAFALHDPSSNAVAAAVLLASFYFNGTTFLGFAILAEKHVLPESAHKDKTLYYSTGLLEGTETILFFLLICVLPAHFAALAYIFSALCFVTGTLRIVAASRIFAGKP